MSTSASHMLLRSYGPAAAGQPIFVPRQTSLTAWVEFASGGHEQPDAADLVLTRYLADSQSSLFHPAGAWLSDSEVARATRQPDDPQGNAVYRFAVPLRGDQCEQERGYAETFAVRHTGTDNWILAPDGEPASVRLPLYVRSDQPLQADLLILAPHPDDEGLACSGVIARAVAAGQCVVVVVVTNGDSLHSQAGPEKNMAYGLRRQAETLRVLALLGLPARQVLFLGYPDNSNLARSRYTDRINTYGDLDGTYGGKLDFHTLTTGTPAPYSPQACISDLRVILEQTRPADVYLPVSSDTHPDHRLMGRLLETALHESGLQATRHYWILHAAEGDARWPPPAVNSSAAFNPEQRFTPERNMPPPAHYPPFDEQVAAPANKGTLIEAYQSQSDLGPLAQSYLLACAKHSEGFWRRDISVAERRLRRLVALVLPVVSTGVGLLVLLAALQRVVFRRQHQNTPTKEHHHEH